MGPFHASPTSLQKLFRLFGSLFLAFNEFSEIIIVLFLFVFVFVSFESLGRESEKSEFQFLGFGVLEERIPSGVFVSSFIFFWVMYRKFHPVLSLFLLKKKMKVYQSGLQSYSFTDKVRPMILCEVHA